MEAYKWYSLAVADRFFRAQAKPRRDTLAKKMTAEQITKAEELAKEWQQKFDANQK